MVSCLFNYFPRVNEVLWLDLETNTDNCLTNTILELYAQYAHWYDPNAVPRSSFYALAVPERTIALFEKETEQPTLEKFTDTLELSIWCLNTFKNNGLLFDLYTYACAQHAQDTLRSTMSIESVSKRFVAFLDDLNSKAESKTDRPHVLAGRNVHYDMSVLRKFAPEIFTRIAKHVYDTGPLSFLSNVLNGVIPSYSSSTSGDHRAIYDVTNTRLTNKDLVDAIVLRNHTPPTTTPKKSI